MKDQGKTADQGSAVSHALVGEPSHWQEVICIDRRECDSSLKTTVTPNPFFPDIHRTFMCCDGL